MYHKSPSPQPEQPIAHHIIAIILKSIGIAAVLVGAAWAVTAVAFKYF